MSEHDHKPTKEPVYQEISDKPVDVHHHYENPTVNSENEHEYNHLKTRLNDFEHMSTNQSAGDYNDGDTSVSKCDVENALSNNENHGSIEEVKVSLKPNHTEIMQDIVLKENDTKVALPSQDATSPQVQNNPPYHTNIPAPLNNSLVPYYPSESPFPVVGNHDNSPPTSPPIVSRESSFSEKDFPKISSYQNQAFEDEDGGSILSFDYGPPLSIYSSQSSRSSSVSGQDSTKAAKEDYSMGSYTLNPSKDSDSDSTDTMIGEEDFQRYLEETQSIAQESGVGSDDCSLRSLSDDEVMLYDLMLNRKQYASSEYNDSHDENQVVFLGQRTTIDI